MKIIKYIFILSISINVIGQTKPIVYLNEKGEGITKEKFINSTDYSKNLDLYFENDSLQYGLLVTRQKVDKLDTNTFKELKNYLAQLSQTQIDSTRNIVVNYLTAFSNNDKSTKSKSTWNVLDKDYTKKLHRIAVINQFWISSPENENLEYYHKNRINWIVDKEKLFKKIFFPYDVKYGYYILIKPDGKFYYYLGEHSKNHILNSSRKHFK